MISTSPDGRGKKPTVTVLLMSGSVMLLPSNLGLLLAIALLTTPALAAEEKTETLHGTCVSGSHASLRKPGTGMISRPFPVYCDTATITHSYRTTITFGGKTAKRPITFEGLQKDPTTITLKTMMLRPGETTAISAGECNYVLANGLIMEITCTAKVEGDARDTVVVYFSSKYGA